VSTPTTTSVIHDIGYKPYSGPRLGRAQIVRALYVHSVRGIFGLGRGAKAKVVPWFVVAVVLIPAALNVFMSSEGKALVLQYGSMQYHLMILSLLFVAIAAPELVSRDLRHHTLPLYFSRPLRRRDYPVAKLLALFSSLLLVELLPVVITYAGQLGSASSGHEIWLDSRAAFPAVFVAVTQSALFAVLSLLIASSTGRRVIATGAIAILFLATTAISGVLEDAVGRTWANHSASCAVPTIPAKDANGPGQFFGFGGDQNGPPTAVVDQLCPGVDLNNDNIENVDGALDPNKPGYADVNVQYQTPVYSMVAKVGGMLDPTDIIEGTRIWVFDATDGEIPNPSPIGPLYAAELAFLVVAGTGGLFLRYRKVSVS
jgi:ABC-2 type transport system permease protein